MLCLLGWFGWLGWLGLFALQRLLQLLRLLRLLCWLLAGCFRHGRRWCRRWRLWRIGTGHHFLVPDALRLLVA